MVPDGFDAGYPESVKVWTAKFEVPTSDGGALVFYVRKTFETSAHDIRLHGTDIWDGPYTCDEAIKECQRRAGEL